MGLPAADAYFERLTPPLPHVEPVAVQQVEKDKNEAELQGETPEGELQGGQVVASAEAAPGGGGKVEGGVVGAALAESAAAPAAEQPVDDPKEPAAAPATEQPVRDLKQAAPGSPSGSSKQDDKSIDKTAHANAADLRMRRFAKAWSDDLPMEGFESFKSYLGLQHMVVSAKRMKSEYELNMLSVELENQKVLVGQMVSIMKSGTKDTSSFVKSAFGLQSQILPSLSPQRTSFPIQYGGVKLLIWQVRLLISCTTHVSHNASAHLPELGDAPARGTRGSRGIWTCCPTTIRIYPSRASAMSDCPSLLGGAGLQTRIAYGALVEVGARGLLVCGSNLTSTKELSALTASRKAEKEKRDKEMKTKETEVQQRKQALEDQQARERIAHVKQTLSFTMGWAKAGHPTVKEIPSLDQVEAHVKNDLYKEPFIIKDMKAGVTLEKLGSTFDLFKKESAVHCTSKRLDKTATHILDAQGLSELDNVWKAVLPSALQLAECLPSTKMAVQSSHMWAHMPTYSGCDFEPQFLGLAKWHAVGKVAYLLVAASKLEQGLKSILNVEVVKLDMMRTWLASLDRDSTTKEQLESFVKSGLSVYHVKVEQGQMLVVPPGFLIACTVLNSEFVAGFRRSFIPVSQGAHTNFSSLRKSSKDNDSAIQFLNSTLDSLVIALSRSEMAKE